MNSRRVVQMIAFTLLCVGLLLLVSKRMRSKELTWAGVVQTVYDEENIDLNELFTALQSDQVTDDDVSRAQKALAVIARAIEGVARAQDTFKTNDDQGWTMQGQDYLVSVIDEWKARSSSSVDIKASSSKSQKSAIGGGFLTLPSEFDGFPMYYIPSLKQPEGWECGYYSLFNAHFIEQALRSGAFTSVAADSLAALFADSSTYNHGAFDDFYRDFCGAFKGGHWLNETEIWNIARSAKLTAYPLSYHSKSTSEYGVLFAQPMRGDVPTREALDIAHQAGRYSSFSEYLYATSTQRTAPWAMYFPAHVGENHWILFAVVNLSGGREDTVILIFDSGAGEITKSSYAAAFARYLYQTFFEVTLQSSSSAGATVARVESWNTYRERKGLMNIFSAYNGKVGKGVALDGNERVVVEEVIGDITRLRRDYMLGTDDEKFSGVAQRVLQKLLEISDELASK